jgi:hypothetical protein
LIKKLEEALDISAKTSKGAAIPKPKDTKLSMFIKKFPPAIVFVNKAAINKGLHGITIAPKKKPNTNALKIGFFKTGDLNFGINLPMSILNINAILINPKIKKAIGETIPITFVRDTSRIVVKTRPNKNMKEITPMEISKPKKIGNLRFCSSSESLLDKYDKNPG